MLFGKTKMSPETPRKQLIPLPDAETLYDHWIYQGLSLRKIGRIYGRSRTTIWQAIRAKYGKDATNPQANGLSRVIAQEYGKAYQRTVEGARGIRGHYLTRKKEDNLSTYQSIDLLDNFQTYKEEYEEGLRLPLFIWFTEGLTSTLHWTLVSASYSEVTTEFKKALKKLIDD